MQYRLLAPLLGVALLSAACVAPAAQREGALLHPMFQDHAVLQRGQPIRVFGQAGAGEEVKLSFAGKRTQARAGADGRWSAMLPAMKAGGPYTLTASAGGITQNVGDVLVGDVWLCSGQSNMELQVHRTLDSRAEIAGADNDRIRLLTVPQTGSAVPLETFTTPTRWQSTTPESVRDFSATCYYFARELQKTVDVPMGLINAAWGGSRIQAWTSGDALRATGNHDAELDVLAMYAGDPVGAAAKWGDLWQSWWSAGKGIAADDRPWSPERPAGTWRKAPRELTAWERWGVPELADFNGMVWYRTTVRLTAAQAAQPATLVLGNVDEIDQTWVNGRGVGSAYGGADRQYTLPPGLLHAGDNTVVVNVLDTYRDGGLYGDSPRVLRFADGSTVPLDGAWTYRFAPKDVGSPPRAPWQTAGGLSTLYNGMIAPIGRYGLRGMLWYQGESNTWEAGRYRELLRVFRDDWRSRFGQDLPLLVVQLAGYGAANSRPTESDTAALREAQRLAVADDPRSGLAITVDIGDRYDIHPANKQEVGRRLARVARHVVYGEALPPSGPIPSAVRRNGDRVEIDFDDATGELLAYGANGPVGFELCGAAAGSCQYADATIHGRTVSLRAPNAATAARVRHCWADSPVCTLYDSAGLPAGPFELPVTPASSSHESAR